MIPFGLLGGFCDNLEIRITELSGEGFSFRVPEKIEKAACLEICFFDFSADCYRKVQLAEKEREMKLTEETPFFFIYSVWTKNGEYREQVKRLVTDYDNYISLKLTGDDAYLSEKMVGYPAELDEVYAESFEEQKKEWFGCADDRMKDCFCEEKEQEEILAKQLDYGDFEINVNDFERGVDIAETIDVSEHKKWNIKDFPKFELTLTIDRPELYNDFLQKDWIIFCRDYWKNNFLEHHPLSQKQATRIYIGNQFCHNLFPEKKQLFQMLEKAFENNFAVTLAFTYIRYNLLEETGKLLQKLEVWCQRKEQEVSNQQTVNKDLKTGISEKKKTKYDLEIIINDWAMPALLQGKAHLKPVLGILLNKRRKDTRLPYKHGIENYVDSLAENNLNCGFYQNYLKNTYNIQRFEFESCGYKIIIPAGTHSLHLPFFQTNTSQYCTLYAACKYGNRGKQKLPENCPKYCDKKVFLYPKHLKMVGRYNSLFGYDERILWDKEYLQNYLEHGIDRIVVNVSL